MDRQKAMKIYRSAVLYAITAENLSAGRTNMAVVSAMLQAGIRVVQYREKEKPAGARYEECLQLRRLAADYGAVFIVDDFVDLALAVEADGVHIGQSDLPPQAVRRLLGNNMVIGLSTHEPSELMAANALSGIVDYFGAGPVFATNTKKDAASATGLTYIEYAAAAAKCPFVAIGGIKEHNIAAVGQAGADMAAVVSDITGAVDIGVKIKALTENIKSGIERRKKICQP